jgi:hypothetical protein
MIARRAPEAARVDGPPHNSMRFKYFLDGSH